MTYRLVTVAGMLMYVGDEFNQGDKVLWPDGPEPNTVFTIDAVQSAALGSDGPTYELVAVGLKKIIAVPGAVLKMAPR
jgi:hypothetical protein